MVGKELGEGGRRGWGGWALTRESPIYQGYTVPFTSFLLRFACLKKVGVM